MLLLEYQDFICHGIIFGRSQISTYFWAHLKSCFLKNMCLADASVRGKSGEWHFFKWIHFLTLTEKLFWIVWNVLWGEKSSFSSRFFSQIAPLSSLEEAVETEVFHSQPSARTEGNRTCSDCRGEQQGKSLLLTFKQTIQNSFWIILKWCRLLFTPHYIAKESAPARDGFFMNMSVKL